MAVGKTRWGIAPDDWNAAVVEIRAILVARARARETITYSDLCAEVTAVHLWPRNPALFKMLEQIDVCSDASDGVMLAAIVRHKGGDRMRGNLFFRTAERLGRDVSDRRAFYDSEVERVFEHYAEAAGGSK